MSDKLTNAAITIRDEKEEGANTAQRVGDAFLLVNQEKADNENEEGYVVRSVDGTLSPVIKEIDERNSRSFVYNLVVDKNGWVSKIETAGKESKLLIFDLCPLQQLTVDVNGWVADGIDAKNRPLKNAVNNFFIPSFYNIEIDEQGNVNSFIRSSGIPTSTLGHIPDRLETQFTEEVEIYSGDGHNAFPAICASKSGVLHAFFRKGKYHTDPDGSIMYTYSKDFGKTWVAPVVFLQGGSESSVSGYTLDYRDCKAIRMSNGKFLFSTFALPAKEISGTPPHHIEYNNYGREGLVFIMDELNTGLLDITNATKIILPRGTGLYPLISSGGLVEHNHIIYHTLYDSNAAWLITSQDMGVTWEVISKIQDGYNENSIAFLDETLYCIMRTISNAGNDPALMVKSNDYGSTWEAVSHLDSYWMGMYCFSIGDAIMISGRSTGAYATIQFYNKSGDAIIQPIRFLRNGESGYSQICSFENYIHVIYHLQLDNTATKWGVFTRKIDRNKVIGINY